MKTLKLTAIGALLALSTAAFAGSPKNNDAKTTDAVAPTETKTTAGTNLVWYPVTYDAGHPSGYIPAGTSSVFTGDKSGAENQNICPDGTTLDCLRGFSSAPSLPTTNMGADQVKTDEPQ